MLSDLSERKEALNVAHSFLVQAPAGSGKTELLIQRYLKLLSETVSNPEEIIAITFTRKAANEMKSRVIASLESVLSNKLPNNPHEELTWNLAKAVVNKDETLNWQIIKNPSRLRILTIDSFSAKLTRQMPILSQFGAQPEIDDSIENVFQKASEWILTHLEEDFPWNNALEILLKHMDNDAHKVQRLFVSMLHNRDQWLPYILERNPRQNLENALGHVIETHLEKTIKLIESVNSFQLLELLSFAGKNIKKYQDSHPFSDYIDKNDFFPPKKQYLNQWQAIANFLLTDAGYWRSRFTKKEGFLPASDANNSEEKNKFQQAKDQIMQLIEDYSNQTGLLEALQMLRVMPQPQYSDEQWKVLNALVDLLPILVAQLYVLFKKTGTVDYTEIALRALQALGQPENPSDLALALDYKIKHILVDEFQDTSVNQFRLLELLTMGWEVNDGRTLFLVGDPMQSIYRFRKAEVGLFIKARDYGINQITLHFLQLSANFRSTTTLVEWNNRIYSKIFPEKDDLAMSAVKFSPSLAFRESKEISQVQLHPCFNTSPEYEADNVFRTIHAIYEKKPDAKIALLVLARTHLTIILEQLKKHHIPYRAIELEKLYHKPVIQDLLALTKALLNLSDKVAWYALLRAPWCGLTLADLLIIKQYSNNDILLHTLENFEELPLSDSGKISLQRVMPILKHAWLCLHDFDLSYVIESVWLAVGGPTCINDSDIINVKRFFDCVEKFESNHDKLDITILENKLQKLTAESPTPEGNYIEVMTIHKSKGLEFDVVIIPGLDKSTKGDDHQLLAWQEIPSEKNNIELLLAPIKSEKKDSIYDYIRYLEKEKSSAELNRLLYVATTRAKHELHLFFNLEIDASNHEIIKEPKSGSLLSQLWPAIRNEIIIIQESNSDIVINKTVNTEKPLRRISKNWQHPYTIERKEALFKNLNSTLINRRYANWKFESEKKLGIVFHKVIESLSKISLPVWQQMLTDKQNDFIKKIVAQFNFPAVLSNEIHTTVLTAINTMLNDPQGLWILAQKGFVEYAMYYQADNTLKKYILDNMFIVDGIIWIIDFKTAIPKDIPLAEFLDLQKNQYKTQLENYKQAVQEIFELPIKMGLYFPMIPAWIEYKEEI